MMKNIFIMIGRSIAAVLIICTIVLMIMAFKDIDTIFTLKLAKYYIALLFLFVIYSIIAISINFRRLKLRKISKLLFRLARWSLGLWISTVLLIYLTKGELRLTDKIFSSISIAFGSVFGGLIFGIREDD
jgi:hypothetical protein